MPIQILRVIFVAIKCYVFGLMAQKYSILSTRRAFSSWYKDKFGGPAKGARVTRMRRRRGVSLWHLRGYSRHFRLTHVEEAKRRGMREMWSSLLRGSPDEKASREYDLLTGSDHFATYRCLVVVPYVVVVLSLPRLCARAIQKSTFVLVTRQSRVSGNYRR